MPNTQAVRHLFRDAHRRVCIAQQRGDTLSLRLWTGLQFPSQMAPMIRAGYMAPIGQERPRALNWYTFTDKGISEYKRRFRGAPDYFADAFDHWQEPVSA